MKRIVAIISVAVVTSATAEVYELQNGQTIEGRVVRVIPQSVKIQTKDGEVIMPADAFAHDSQLAILGGMSDKAKIAAQEKVIEASENLIEILKKMLHKHAPQVLPERVSSVEAIGSEPAEGDMPAEILRKVKAIAAADHPDDPSTQLYVVKGHLEAWQKLKAFPDSPIKRKAAREHPFDYATQLYVVENAHRDAEALSNLR